MKKLIIIALLCGAAYMIAGEHIFNNTNVELISDSDGSTLEVGDEFMLRNGKNEYYVEISSTYNEYLRLYGINDNKESSEWSPIGYAKYIFVCSPNTGSTAACEGNDAKKAATIPIIIKNKEAIMKIGLLQNDQGKRSATIIGKKVNINKFLYNGEDHTDSLSKMGNLNPRKALLIEEVVIE